MWASIAAMVVSAFAFGGVLVTSYVTLRGQAALRQSMVTVVKDVAEVKHNTNSLTAQLVDETRIGSLAAGNLTGRKEQAAESALRAEGAASQGALPRDT